MREYCNPIRLERMRYSHPSIFPSLWDVPISLSHSNNKTHFFFSFLESEIHAKTIEKSNKIQETERREGLRWWFSSSKSERPSLLAVYYGIQGIIGYSNSLELQVQLCLSLSLSLSLDVAFFSLLFPSLFLSGKATEFWCLYIWNETKRLPGKQYNTKLLFYPSSQPIWNSN